jgi:nitrate reductase delta subunit
MMSTQQINTGQITSKQALLDAMASLFRYPGGGQTDGGPGDPQEEFVERLETCRELVEKCTPGRGEKLAALIERCRGMSRGEIEEMFTRTFEINPVCALEVGWHVYGEEYARGALMVRLREELREHGIPEITELPDHLTHVLQLLGRLDTELADDLSGRYVIPALGKMLEGIAGKDCPYEELLEMTRDVINDTHDPIVVQQPVKRPAAPESPESQQGGLPILQPQPQHSVCGPGCTVSDATAADATAWEAEHGI